VARAMTTESLERLIVTFPWLAGSHLSLALFAPVSMAQRLRSIWFPSFRAYPARPDGAGAIGKSFEWAIRRVRLAGAIWPCLPDLTLDVSARYAGMCPSCLFQGFGRMPLGTRMGVQEAMCTVGGPPLACS
jgi:hypothetical protein